MSTPAVSWRSREVWAPLAVAASVWPWLGPDHAVVPCLVAAGAMVLMFQARRQALAAGLAAPALATGLSARQVRGALSKLTMISLLALAAMPAPAWAADVSRYRDFRLGSDLAAVAKQAGLDPSQARVVHSRPALIQELEWRPQASGASSRAEAAKDVVFTFYNGELYRIVVNYDRYEMEGLTAEDIAAAFSAGYGTAVVPPAPPKSAQDSYGEQAEVVARWQDPQHRFDLVRLSYGPSFRLIGVLNRLEAPVQAAALEAARLDDLEAPRKDAERAAAELRTERAKLEKARLVNQPKFRP